MAEIYSPELYAAQSELIEAAKAAPGLSESRLEIVKNSAARTIKAAREKLRLLGLAQDQIDSILKRGSPSDHITLHAPLSGVVTRREVTEGMYLRTGSPIYTIADISRVWIILEGYESDLPWLKTGTQIEFTCDAIPGKTFSGKVAYIDPFVNEKTRTASVRVDAENPSFALKPGMYVKAVYSFNTSGLLRPEKESLLIPAEAPLITGKRAVVYVAVPDKEGVYEGREIVLGPKAGEYYVVEEGLKEGEMVVTRGAFKLDSSLQILAKPSMMGEGGSAAAAGHIHSSPAASPANHAGHDAADQAQAPAVTVSPVFKKMLGKAILSYTLLSEALAADSDKKAGKASEDLLRELSTVKGALLPPPMQKEWEAISESIKDSITAIRKGNDIPSTRKAFDIISRGFIAAATKFGADTGKSLFELFCPMAFDGRGAFWLQTDQEVRNPYFGAEMLACGEVKGKLPGNEN
jgi:Cu(I)/Ag(I) efflux system membrane fusion protein